MRHARNRYVSPEIVISAYHQGFFPMANEHGEIGFYSFEPRGIIPLDDRFTVRRSLRQILRRGDYEIRYDFAPEAVLHACSRAGTIPSYELWLSDDLIEIYLELYKLGYLHTVEVWQSRGGVSDLVGGLYGISIGGAFCGESMFSRIPFASQIALVHLVERLRRQGFLLLDAQMSSNHLKQFGLYECTQAEYLTLFTEASSREVRF